MRLVGVVVRRYIFVLIYLSLLLLYLLFFVASLLFFNVFSVLVPYLFCNLFNNVLAQYKHIWATEFEISAP